MLEYRVAEHAFYVLSFCGVGVWTILQLGFPGLVGKGVPFVPPHWSDGLRGRVLGALLCAAGAAFLAISFLALAQLLPRLK